jgi:hypothetical protein
MIRTAVIAACALVALVAGGAHYVKAILHPVAVVVVPGEILAGVSSADAKQLRDFYAAMADIVVRDGKAKAPVCRTTLDLRSRHQQALSLAFANTAMVGKYAGLGERLDEYLLVSIGRLDIPLTADVRKAAAKAFSDIK